MTHILLIFVALSPLCTCFLTFSVYVSQYSKTYAQGSQQQIDRQSYYATSVLAATQIQLTANYTVQQNEYWDRSPQQRAKLMRSVKILQNPSGNNLSDYKTGGTDQKPTIQTNNIDWVALNKVTPVRNQGNCGSAWDFSVVAMSQSSIILKQQQVLDLSQQQVLQCTSQSTCNGGYVQYALQTAANLGLLSQAAYAYNPSTTVSGICSVASNLIFPGNSHFQFYSLNDSQIIQLMNYGPVVAHISAENWIYYHSGVFYCSSQSPVAHAVLLTGFTADYWIAKNSWGTGWGESGYIRISRANNNCGVGTAVYVLWNQVVAVNLWLFILAVMLLTAV